MEWQCKKNSFINPSGYRQIFKESELIMEFRKQLIVLLKSKIDLNEFQQYFAKNTVIQVDLGGPYLKTLKLADEVESSNDYDQVNTIDLIKSINFIFSIYDLASDNFTHALRINDYNSQSISVVSHFCKYSPIFQIKDELVINDLCIIYEDIRRIDNYKEDLELIESRGLWPDYGLSNYGTSALKLVEKNIESSYDALTLAMSDLYDSFLDICKVDRYKL